jgi:hypothetical protein
MTEEEKKGKPNIKKKTETYQRKIFDRLVSKWSILILYVYFYHVFHGSLRLVSSVYL